LQHILARRPFGCKQFVIPVSFAATATGANPVFDLVAQPQRLIEDGIPKVNFEPKPGAPLGRRFSHVYRDRGQATVDSAKMRLGSERLSRPFAGTHLLKAPKLNWVFVPVDAVSKLVDGTYGVGNRRRPRRLPSTAPASNMERHENGTFVKILEAGNDLFALK
jgi:hypothetical protein